MNIVFQKFLYNKTDLFIYGNFIIDNDKLLYDNILLSIKDENMIKIDTNLAIKDVLIEFLDFLYGEKFPKENLDFVYNNGKFETCYEIVINVLYAYYSHKYDLLSILEIKSDKDVFEKAINYVYLTDIKGINLKRKVKIKKFMKYAKV